MSDESTINDLFGNLRRSRFGNDPNDVIQSSGTGSGNIQPLGGFIADGVVVAESFDTTPPDPPTNLALSSDVVVNSDAGSFVRLLVGLTQPADADLFGSYVEVTSQTVTSDGLSVPLAASTAGTAINTTIVHGLSLDDPVRFSALTGGTGLFIDQLYYVVEVTDTDTFKVGTVIGGAALSFSTDITAGTVVAQASVPVWDRPHLLLIAKGQSQGRIDDVQGSTRFFARARAADVLGNYSAYTDVISHFTTKDAEAPPLPQGVTVIAGYRGFGAYWTPSSASDLQFFQMRWAPDLTGAPDTSQWSYHLTTATTVFIGQLTPDVTYWFQVRAVDKSGNVATSDADPTAVDYLANPEAGWTTALSVVPTLVGSADLAVNSVSAALGHISDLNADQISAGTMILTPSTGPTALKVNTSGGITVVDLHNDGTMKFSDPTNPNRFLILDSGQLKFTTDGGATYTTMLTPDGFYGDAVKLGALPGGHNLVRNSSFELTQFVGISSSGVFTDFNMWAAAQRFTAPDNIADGGAITALSATTLSF